MSDVEALRGQLDKTFVPLDEQQREAFPHIIYQQESEATADKAILATALAAAQESGLPLVADVTFNQETGRNETVIRSSSADRMGRPSRTESALFHGAAVIAEKTFFALGAEGVEASEALQTTKDATQAALRQITDNEELHDAFRKYYGGLRWSTDQERFTQSLFEQAAELDLDLVAKHVTKGRNVMHVMHDLDVDLPFERTRDWYEMDATEVLAQAPELDYRKLADPEFAVSEAGQRLAEGYRKFCGYQAGQDYKAYPRPITDEGELVPKPIIPLSRFPLVEALMVDEVSLTRPSAKYDMGPQEVVDFILHSDSLPAQQALVSAVTKRLPREQRYVFDGPHEFQHKRYVIRQITSAYRTDTNPERHEQFKQHLLDVFDAYTGDGAIATEMRTEYWQEERREFKWHADVNDTKDIVRDMLVVGLASPDAEAFAGRYMPDFEKGLATERDPLSFTQTEMMMIVLDALNLVDGRSNPAIFEHIGRKVFQDEAIARTLKEIAELESEASILWRAPEVLLALKAKERFRYLGLEERKTDPDSLAADAAHEAAIAPSQAKGEAARNMKNTLILEYLTNMANTDIVGEDEEANGRLFNLLADRLSFGDTWHMRALPTVYNEIIKLAKHPNVPDDLRAHLLWKFAENVKYSDNESARLLVGAILEGYHVMLGDPEAIRLPGSRTDHGLAALNHIAYNNPIFKFASEAQLLTLSRYKGEIIMMAERIAGGVLTDGGVQPEEGQTLEDWQTETLKNLKEVMDEMNRLEERYKEYLHIEEVKVKPHVFYPWLRESFAPFWQRLQREAGPDSDYGPSTELRQLYAVMKDHVDNLRVFKDDEYPEDFDVVEDGGLGSLLLEGYKRMVIPHDIKYNNVVYHDGMSFMHAAVVYMPETVVEQLKAKYPDQQDFLDYIDKNRAYWHKAEQE